MKDNTVIARSEATKQSIKARLLRVLCTLAMTVLVIQNALAAENATDSKKFYEAAVKAQPKNANAHYDLGNVYFMEERYADALANYLEAGSLGLAAVRMGNYYFNVSVCYFKLGKTEEAIRSVEACLKIDPGRKSARDMLAVYESSIE